jgi:hypothetical protein
MRPHVMPGSCPSSSCKGRPVLLTDLGKDLWQCHQCGRKHIFHICLAKPILLQETLIPLAEGAVSTHCRDCYTVFQVASTVASLPFMPPTIRAEAFTVAGLALGTGLSLSALVRFHPGSR